MSQGPTAPSDGRPAVDGPDDRDVDQPVLPLDLDPDEPVPFRLTPRARRVVAPDSVPALEVVAPPSPGDDAPDVPLDLDDPHDPRSARARAMRRGGLSVPAIADRLGVDELVARTWAGDLGRRRRRRPRLRAVSSAGAAGPADDAAGAGRLAQRHRAFEDARDRAARQVGDLLADPAFVRGLALTVAAADVDPHAVLVGIRDLGVARAVRRWLVDRAGADPRDLRVVLRLGSASAADLVVHQWAEALDVPADRMARTAWRSAPSDDAVEALVRVADGAVAARVAGWRDAMLADAPPPVPEDAAF